MAYERFDNRASFLGRLTADPEYKTVGDSETGMTTFRIAVQRPKTGNSEHPEADFIPCTAWGKQAEIIAKHFAKGNKIGVAGAIQTRTYEDKDGNKRNAWDLQVGAFSFIEKKSDGESSQPSDEEDSLY